MSDTLFEPDLYLRLSLVDTATALTFAKKVLIGAPKKPPAPVKKALAPKPAPELRWAQFLSGPPASPSGE